MTLQANQTVQHPRFGNGTVVVDQGDTVIVRFEHGIEECERQILTIKQSLEEKVLNGHWDNPQETLARGLAFAINSINEHWGLFSLSRIQLLPHQLWVCHRVMRIWPANYLIADDVGLGKTIEAGLILWPLIAKGLVKRVLILCPASLTEQWQERLKDMFDLRFTRYSAELDTPKSGYWNANDQVIASLPTLRKDQNGRHQRMLDAEPWDLLVVDEAHHLNMDEDTGATLGYSFVYKLIERGQFKSRIFFSGTPHRGKNYNFIALLRLLDPEQFNPQAPLIEQLPYLRDFLIRNNKQSVSDMAGNLLFKPVQVYPETYSYSQSEETFYNRMTNFIVSGKAYAASLESVTERRNVTLVLIALQKLASSSVAAIQRALQRRLKKLQDELKKQHKKQEDLALLKKLNAIEDDALLQDELQRMEEAIAEATLSLLKDEIPHLQDLLEAAEAVKTETKIQRILELIETRFPDRQILFFTEYKATQALLMSALLQHYGKDCVTFINGDERLEAVYFAENQKQTVSIKRTEAADQFNAGKIRFLISTEAGGEGIDLQQRCHSLIHVDLPWNPMRMHQRVGRLNRYGQQHTVEVITLRNPDTVESRIWDKLNTKLHNIMRTLGSAMDEPEDLLQLVLGMTSNSLFTELFSNANTVGTESLSAWFDDKTQTFGGTQAIETVKALVGNSARFDLGVLAQIPKKDLQDLLPFFTTMLKLNKRRINHTEEGGLSFKTPDAWLADAGVRRRYENLQFARHADAQQVENPIGVGHRAFNQALRQALDYDANITWVADALNAPLFIFRVYDKVTEATGNIRQVAMGVSLEAENEHKILLDWQLLDCLNALLPQLNDTPPATEKLAPAVFNQWHTQARQLAKAHVQTLDLPFKVADINLVGVIYRMMPPK